MQDAFAYCAELVRTADRDRFLASLFAPAEHRGALHALYAFNVEVTRVREVAREPLPGEIRLQWWSEVVNGETGRRGERQSGRGRASHGDRRHRLAAPALTALLDAHRFDLYDDPMARLADLEAYARKTSSALLALAAQILGGEGEVTEAVANPAGIAYDDRRPPCARSRCTPRGGSSTCRSNCSNVMESTRRTYSPANPRKIFAAHWRSCRPSLAAICLLPTNR